jgi:hydrogenase nickel incorporation protein HypA/HybF
MHEMSLASALMQLIPDQLAAANATRTTRVVLEIGALSHVDAHALRFAFEAVSDGGPAGGAELVIHEPPGRAWCLDCETPVAVTSRESLCPRCGGAKLLAQGGDEMRLVELEVV